MSVVISVENVSKQYRLGEVGTGTLSHDLNRWWHKVRGKDDPYLKIGEVNDRTKKAGETKPETGNLKPEGEEQDETGNLKPEDKSNPGGTSSTSGLRSQPSSLSSDYSWALRDINFEVKQGEVLGIIGRNGAGKSTLLKILSRVTTPTTGQIKVKGRIASLLEVGTGFHPELTGRENIFLNGAILGMRKWEIAKKFDEIVEFSGCERYIDTPVKRYSSGMYVRLAFAVAAHLEPEILIVDEVLAVGDAEFQKKCLGKMKDIAGQGRTVLFVSHNMGAVLQLTTSGVVLANGYVSFIADPISAVQHYSSQCQTDDIFYETEHQKRTWTGSQEVKFVSLKFEGSAAIFAHEQTIGFIATLRAKSFLPPCRVSLTIFRADGTAVGSCFGEEVICLSAEEATDVLIRLHGVALAPGHYYMGVGVGRGNHLEGHLDYDVVFDILRFEVQAPIGSASQAASWSHGWGSMILPTLETVKIN